MGREEVTPPFGEETTLGIAYDKGGEKGGKLP